MLKSGAPQTTHSTAPSTFSECSWAPCSQIARNPRNRMQHSPSGRQHGGNQMCTDCWRDGPEHGNAHCHGPRDDV